MPLPLESCLRMSWPAPVRNPAARRTQMWRATLACCAASKISVEEPCQARYCVTSKYGSEPLRPSLCRCRYEKRPARIAWSPGARASLGWLRNSSSRPRMASIDTIANRTRCFRHERSIDSQRDVLGVTLGSRGASDYYRRVAGGVLRTGGHVPWHRVLDAILGSIAGAP